MDKEGDECATTPYLNPLVPFQASFLGCDILMDPDRIPPMVKDYYWDNNYDQDGS